MKRLLVVTLAIMMLQSVHAQKIAVTYDKTVHMVFPSKILYVDLGSETIMASIIEEKPNMLRVKAAERNFKNETNLSVVLEGDIIHCFDVFYEDSLKQSVYEIGIVKQEDLPTESKAEKIYRKDLTRIESIGCSHHGISLTLKSLYCDGSNIYFHLELKNRSFIPFSTEAITVGTDRIRNLRRGQPGGTELTIDERFGEPDIKGNYRTVLGLKSFTFRDDEILRIQIFEKGGSRHMGLEIDSRTFKRMMEVL